MSQVLILSTDDAAHTSLPSPCSLLGDASIWATSPQTVVVRRVFYGFVLFCFPPSYVALWGSKTPHRPACERDYCVETSPSQFPPLGGRVSIPNSMSLFLSFIFCPTSFQREWAAFLGAWCPPLVFRSCFVEVDQHSNDFFDEFVGEKVVSLSYSSTILGPPSTHYFKF